jgi:superfamily II DNA or RNA helicase
LLQLLQQTRVKALTKLGQLDVVIHVGQLGEGFDAPALSVVAVFRVFRSMAPFMQLLGRAARRIPVSGKLR